MKTLSSLSPCPGGVSWGSGGLPRAGGVPLTAGGLARGRGCSRDDVEQGTHSCPGTRRHVAQALLSPRYGSRRRPRGGPR
jgi:hypothetical protein